MQYLKNISTRTKFVKHKNMLSLGNKHLLV